MQTTWSILNKRCSEGSLILGLFMVPLSITLSNIFIILAAVLSLVCFDRGHYRAMCQHPITPWALALFALVLLGMLWSSASMAAQWGAVQKYSKFISLILLLPLLSNRRNLLLGLNAFLAAVLITVVISYLRSFGWVHATTDPDAVFHNHIIMSFFVAFACYLALYFAYTQRAYRWLYLIFFVVLTIQEFFINQGRTGFIIYLSLILLFGFQYFRWKGIVFAVFLCGLLFAAGLHFSSQLAHNVNLSITSVSHYSQGTTAAQETSWGFRLSFAKASLKLIEHKPWIGSGTGSFPTEFAKIGGVPGWGRVLATPHNEYLLFAVQFGLLGLALFILFFVRLFYLAFHYTGIHARPAQALLVACTLGYFCDALFFTSAVGYFTIAMMGLLFHESSR